MLAKACDVSGCTKPPRSSGSRYCERHYYRLRRTGTVDLPSYPESSIGADGYPIDRNRSISGFNRQHRRILFGKIGPGEHPCSHCGKLVSWDEAFPQSSRGLVVDHLDDNKENNAVTNLVASCGACNIKRGSAKMKATKQAQSLRVSWQGASLMVEEWAQLLGISGTQFRRRLAKWTIEEAVSIGHCGTGPKRQHMEGDRG